MAMMAMMDGGKGAGWDDWSSWGGDMMGKGWDKGGCGGYMDKGGCMEKGWKGKGKDGKDGKGGCGGDKGKGKVMQKLAAGECIYHGAIKNYNAEKSHGYVVCEDIYAITGKDVYAFKDVLERGGAGPGDYLAFFIHWSPKGQPQVSSPILRLGAEKGYALKGYYKASQTPGKAFGFLDCRETMEFFGRDVYVNMEMAQNLSPGQAVAFNCYLNRDGMPNAANLEPVPEEWEPMPSDLSESRQATNVEPATGKGKGGKFGGGVVGGKGSMGKGWGGDSWGGGPYGDSWGSNGSGDMWGKGSWGGGKDAWGSGGKGMDSWGGGGGGKDAWGGYGGGKDAWGYGGGKGMDNDWGWGGMKGGKKGGCGKNMGTPAKKPEPTGKFYTGMVKSFNAMNNYGFIACEDVKTEYGNDVFIHGSALEGHEVGATVVFELALNSKGQPQAINLKNSNGEEPDAKKMKMSPEWESAWGENPAMADASAMQQAQDAWGALGLTQQPDQQQEQQQQQQHAPAQYEQAQYEQAQYEQAQHEQAAQQQPEYDAQQQAQYQQAQMGFSTDFAGAGWG